MVSNDGMNKEERVAILGVWEVKGHREDEEAQANEGGSSWCSGRREMKKKIWRGWEWGNSAHIHCSVSSIERDELERQEMKKELMNVGSFCPWRLREKREKWGFQVRWGRRRSQRHVRRVWDVLTEREGGGGLGRPSVRRESRRGEAGRAIGLDNKWKLSPNLACPFLSASLFNFKNRILNKLFILHKFSNS